MIGNCNRFIHPFFRVTRSIIFMVDCSDSMTGEKMDWLNHEMNQGIMLMREHAEEELWMPYFRILKFSTGASWVTPDPVPAEEYIWQDLDAGGMRDLGSAFELLSSETASSMQAHREKPVIILLLDGHSTDDYRESLKKLQKISWFRRAVKIGLAIGRDTDYEALQNFTGTADLVLDGNRVKANMFAFICRLIIPTSDIPETTTISLYNQEETIMEMKLARPGGEIANRPLHFFWVVDCSGSMEGAKIGTVNHAIQSTIKFMRDAASNNPNAQLYIRTLKFGTGASWVTADPVRVEDFEWQDLNIEEYAVTDLGKAYELIAAQLEMPPMPERALPPVIVLLSDGYPTDDWKKPLEKLLKMPWGKKAVKIAIAIGQGADKSVLEKFTGNSELVLEANKPERLVHLIKWASTVASTVSAPATKPDTEKEEAEAKLPNGIVIEDIPEDESNSEDDVW